MDVDFRFVAGPSSQRLSRLTPGKRTYRKTGTDSSACSRGRMRVVAELRDKEIAFAVAPEGVEQVELTERGRRWPTPAHDRSYLRIRHGQAGVTMS